MRATLTGLVILVVVLAIHRYWQSDPVRRQETSVADRAIQDVAPAKNDTSDSFTCEGKTRCSQMRSCEEAKYYLANCPDTQMDGDNDGMPCESQWCGN
jgi:hypothetical protein